MSDMAQEYMRETLDNLVLSKLQNIMLRVRVETYMYHATDFEQRYGWGIARLEEIDAEERCVDIMWSKICKLGPIGSLDSL